MSNLEKDVTLQPDWTDLRVPMSAVATVSGAGLKAPDYTKLTDDGAGSTGLYCASFPTNQERELFFMAQLPHAYQEGTDVEPHLHWSPSNTANTGVVRWGLEYTWTNVGDVIGNSTIIYLNTPVDGTGLKSIMSDFNLIVGAGKLISSQFHGRLFRDAGHIDDTYPDPAFLIEADFHFRQDSLGSSLEHSK